jgi:hypothetical protein
LYRLFLVQFELLKEKKEKELAEVSAKIEDELKWFQGIRKRDLKHILGEFIRSQVKYYVECRDSWKRTLEQIK